MRVKNFLRLVFFVASISFFTAVPAQSPKATGAQHFNTDTVSAFVSTNDLFILLFATRSPSLSFAVINVFDSTGFSQCLNSAFEIAINRARATLSFITEGVGENCASDQQIHLVCEATSHSGIFHNVTNGTAKIPAFDQQFTTHGENDHYTNMSCVLTAFGAQHAAPGGEAFSERLTTTP